MAGEIVPEDKKMDEEQKSINEIISELEVEDVKQEDIAWGCIENELNNQSIPEYDAIPHEDYHIVIYQESEFYNPFAFNKKNIV